MSDKGVIIREIRGALDRALKKAIEKKNKLDSRGWWTERVMTELCAWGLRNQYWVGAAGRQKREDMRKLQLKYGGTIGDEWLYDLTCIKYNHGWLKRVPLVVECEWGTTDQINDDFEKLLLARADVRLMIFNGNYYRDEGQKSIPSNGLDVFRRYIRNYEHTRTGDTYLFAARLHEGEDGASVKHRFDHHVFIA